MRLRVTGAPPHDTIQVFDAFTTRVMDTLRDLEDADPGIVDADISANLATRTVDITMGVTADSHRDAGRLFRANVRAALNAAVSGMPEWPTPELTAPREYAEADAS